VIPGGDGSTATLATLADARRRAVGLLDDDPPLLVVSDFDGTLCPIADSPAEVRLGAAMAEILNRLAVCDRTALAVISGRSLADIASRVPANATVSGNHGLEISGPGMNFRHSEAAALRPDLAAACDALREAMRIWPGAWVEDKGLSATAHYRRVPGKHHRCLLQVARRALRGFGNRLALRVGNNALEVRPRVAWDKGAALEYIRQSAGPFDVCICMGDDRTDETMFRANQDGLNIKVGRGQPSAASYQLIDPGEVAIFLSHVLDFCELPRTSAAGSLICA
jgi:trehalose 6-phosphate phosphatase